MVKAKTYVWVTCGAALILITAGYLYGTAFCDWAVFHPSSAQAISAIVVAIFTVALTLTSVLQWWAARRSSDVLLALERPLIALRMFELEGRNSELGGDTANWFITLRFKNVGKSAAFFEDFSVNIVEKNSLGKKPVYTGEFSKLGLPFVIEAGQEFTPTPEKFGPGGRKGTFVVVGRITYKDVAGVSHKTGFAVEVASYMPAGGPYGGSEYNYHT